MLQTIKDVMTSGEAAGVLKVHVSTLTRWVADGKIASIGKAGRYENAPFQFDPDEVERVRAARAQLAPKEVE